MPAIFWFFPVLSLAFLAVIALRTEYFERELPPMLEQIELARYEMEGEL